MKRRIFPLVLVVLALAADSGWAQEDRPILEEWREVLRYGIDNEVLKVIKSISDAGERGLNPELSTVFRESLDFEVRKAVLDYFGRDRIRDAEEACLALIDAESLENPRLQIALIQYLAAVQSPGLEARLLPFLDHRDAQVAEAAIATVGKVGGEPAGQALLERLQAPEYPGDQKPEIILALGGLKYTGAVAALIAIVDNRDEERIRRMYAATALGDIADEQAIPYLKAMFAESDSLVKAYAASALAKFNMTEVEILLQQGLRDSNVRVRLAAAQALADKEARASVDILIYKARNDPESQVRVQAIKSLGVIGTGQAFEFLRDLYADKKVLPLYREEALSVLCEHDLSASLDALRKVVEDEWGSKDQKVVEFTAKKLASTEASGLKWFYERFLGSSSVYVRIYGLRGIEKNSLRSLRDQVEKISKEDPYPAARKIALSVLEKL